jgi:hypothetical protein
MYRVAAINPEQLQSFAGALKVVFYINYFAQIHLIRLPKCKQKQTDTLRQR